METTTETTAVNISIKTKMSYIYNKLMKLVSCTTNAVDTTCEPTTPIEEEKETEKEKEVPVVEETNVAIEQQQQQQQQQQQVVVEELTVLVEPVVEQPVSIEERM